MDMLDKILFIDDELFYARAYVERLEKLYEVIYNNNAQDGLQTIRNQPELKLVVLDIMMPPPEGVSDEDVETGLATGIWMLSQLKARITNLSRPLPVIVLTNRRRDRVEEMVRQLGFARELVSVNQKNDTPAFYLPKVAAQLIERWYPRG